MRFNQLLTKRARVIWMTLLLTLSPLAYLASVAILRKFDPSTRVGFEMGRTEAVRAAARHARELGINVEGWRSGVQVDVNNDRYFYYRLRGGADVERARRAAPEAGLRVLFQSPDGKEKLQVSLGKDGRPLGFNRTLSPNREIPDAGEAASRQIAGSAFRALTQTDSSVVLGAPELKEERKFNRVIRRYTWKQKFAALPELELHTSISVAGDTTTAQEVATEFDKAFADRNFLNRHIAGQLTVVPLILLVILFSLFGLYRYIQRSRQKEVPHARSLLVCLLMTGAFLLMAFQTDFLVFSATPAGGHIAVTLIILLISGAAFLLMGAFTGMAYGSGEGDVREEYPGKLTSLDALLTGRILSRNVARAICIGVALGGWSLLARALTILPWAGRPDGGLGLTERGFSILFGQLNWAAPLMMPFFAVLTVVLGVLMPLSFLHGRFRSRRLSLAFLVSMSLVSSALVFQEQPVPFLAGLLSAIVASATLLVAFFVFDLLTSIITSAVPSVVVFVLYLVSQPAASLNRGGYIAGGISLLMLLVGIVFWRRGREYSEDEVRPLYARNLAERMGLQAEVSAAREAQARLMPLELPVLPGLHLAAACLPARVVGGDFYDLFVLDKNKLGIFIAEGGGRGLGAALTIAYAKGFLMPRIDAGHSPAGLICSLQTQLAPLLEQDEELALAYAVVDTSEKTLAYARTGFYPRILTGHRVNAGGERARIRVPAEEREFNLAPATSSDAASPATNCVIREATIPLDDGDVIVFVTDGVVRSLGEDGTVSMEDWAFGVVSERRRKQAVSLQQSLDEALEKRAKHIKKIGYEDDLTAVVVRVEADGERAS